MGRSFVICDSESEYAEHLADYVEQSRRLNMRVYVCEEPSGFSEVCPDEEADIFVVDEMISFEERMGVPAKKRVVLTRKEGVEKRENAEEIFVFKYRSGEEILKQIVDYCDGADGIFHIPSRDRKRLIGVYAPTGRIGKTEFAVCLGKELAKWRETLYLNFGVYENLASYCTEMTDRTLLDLLYYAKQEGVDLGTKASVMTGQMGELSYVEPAKVAEDLKAVDEEMWVSFLNEMMGKGVFQVVILDLSESVRGLPGILKCCDVIYMPVTDSDGEEERIMKFEENMAKISKDKILGKVKRVSLKKDVKSTVGKLVEEEKQWI